VFLFVKYYQSNFSFTIPVSTLLISCILIIGTLLGVFNQFAVNGEYTDIRSKTFFSALLNEFMMFLGFFYITGLFVGLILLEYNQKNSGDNIELDSTKKFCSTFTKQFYVFCMLAFLFCLFYGIWVIHAQKKLALGIIVILIACYPGISIVTPAKWMQKVTQAYAVVFVLIGVVVFFLRTNKPTIISDISVAFFGSYLVCTFAYIRAHMINRKKRDT
jgi:hypothetical protein